jgi:hypothetical protein
MKKIAIYCVPQAFMNDVQSTGEVFSLKREHPTP